MRFLRKNKVEKVVLVISDIHLGAGVLVEGKRNPLEDFHSDEELVEFLEFYSSGEYQVTPVELIINGDFLDFLAVPFVRFFDDEYWSERAALEKFKLIEKAHPEVFNALSEFTKKKNHSLTYVLGNHDAEMLFPKVKEQFLAHFGEDHANRVKFIFDGKPYFPAKGVMIKHGHEYEYAHDFDPKDSIIESSAGEKYFTPPWGSYYVTRVINKFKRERPYINQVRPIRSFLINGLIYDTLFTLRFMFANVYYFFMVRTLEIFFHHKKSLANFFESLFKELEIFIDFDLMLREFFQEHPDVEVLIVGHTHEPTFRIFEEDRVFINTGTWTKMHNMDFSKKQDGFKLTYAKINILPLKDEDSSPLDYSLNIWKGASKLPYREFV